MIKCTIIIPLYKDWESFEILLSDFARVLDKDWDLTKILVVDDFSLQTHPSYLKKYAGRLEVIELTRNMGHQKAIAIGLSYAAKKFPDTESFIVMDSDGEDKPEDIPVLLSTNGNDPFSITFAHRRKRTEVKSFRFSYKLYKQFFRILTGQKISFGNFCVLSNEATKRLVHVSEIWLHFSSGVIKSRIPFKILPLSRGTRYKGKSKMNFTGLVSHGLSAIAVYSEYVAVRITLIAMLMSILSLCGIIVLFGIKQLTNLAIPGWTSFVTLGLLILIAQFFSLGILLAFIILSSKTLKNINPSLVFNDYIYSIHVI